MAHKDPLSIIFFKTYTNLSLELDDNLILDLLICQYSIMAENHAMAAMSRDIAKVHTAGKHTR